MIVTWMRWEGWSAPLIVGLWLLTGQGAIAREPFLEKAAVTANSLATEAAADSWLSQLDPTELIEITDVRLEETPEGLTLRLETAGELAEPVTAVIGNAAIADIPNALLSLSADDSFFASTPTGGIALVEITNRSDNQVRIAITGVDAPPTLAFAADATGLTIRTVVGDPAAPDSALPNDSIQLVVTGDQAIEEGYFVPAANTATRTDTPILDTPAAIQVIPQQVLEDQQVTDLGEALRNISGVAVNSTEGRGFQVSLRGFEGASIFRDGFRLYSPNDNGDAAGQGFPEIANIERIEVLRGPSSILFGQIEPGGAVNVVSKRPLDSPFYEVALQTDSRGLVRPQVDISGPLTEDGRALYRLNALYQREDSFRDFEGAADRFFVAPALAWKLGDRTDLNLQLEYLNDQRPLDPGLVALGDEVADIPRSRILGEPDDTIDSEFVSVGYDLEHRVSDSWTIRNALRYLSKIDDISATLSFPFIGGLNEATGDLNRVFAEQTVSNETLALQTNVVGEFSTGSIDHTLLLGLDLARYRLYSDSFTDFAQRTPLNIFDPIYGALPRPERGDTPTSQESIGTSSLQLYAQDQISLLDNLILVAGFNYETVNQTTTTIRGGRTIETDRSEDAFSPRVGLIYQPAENLSLYANYSRSFYPSAALTVEGEPLEPEAGEGFEVGIKTELLDRRLLATLAYFNLTKRNVATADPSDPRFSVATGEQQSQGIELDVVGELSPGWNLIASYAYIDAAIAADNRFETGNRLPGVPEHSASLWTKYEIQSGDFAGLGFGLGVNWVGDRQGDLQNSFDLGSYFLTNAAVSYQRDSWRFGLNFQNLFDVNFIEGSPRTRTRGIEPGEPFTVLGSISYKF
ncbi:TonB-dependent siderophore receptor [soil metagenome]